MSHTIAEYIWIDGHEPTKGLRSKAKIITGPVNRLEDLPDWGFDGSSTEQAEGHASDCRLKPVRFVRDPFRGGDHVLVMCEVFTEDGRVHPSNTRARLREVSSAYADHEPWFGIEQEYTLFQDGRPLGWPEHGYPGPQGPYYCAVGARNIYGRELVEAHLQACLDAGLRIAGINAEVMPSQWEFQVGPLGPLDAGDELWLARWMLHRLGEELDIEVSLSPKPVKGDWNGAGAHTNFSTKAMRAPGGIRVIEEACQKLGRTHEAHIKAYGYRNGDRLTGKHETCDIHTFRYGASDRGASIRIPIATTDAQAGYLEDRRPAANMDPYLVARAIIETTCGNGFIA
ncbi:glutamine synthetase [Candidatus Uhrbacteria bacterium CG_4_9_14_3_um_filter_50_9]|uniref:Glutamine synthetase n=1 Tax=Candidatus Uhrbacteria bacterium CG_4_9_14_3_um_filter_50_9 TaxID=1975035 RepID=A0A2M7XBA1_9BACT|nr:MAG: glutamine synthetase [Candidatus Uhrbacteria bacterium CG_4_9_14_3_um_filter_50_9]